METRAHYVVVGLFTVIVICAALLSSLWLTKAGSDNQFRFYDVVFNEAVNGLSQGSSVQYSGIKVGDVTQLKLDPKNPNKVLARIRVSASTPIRQDTQAKLTPTGITGTAIIQLSSGKGFSPMLKSDGNEVPIIVATPSSLSKLLTNSEDLMTNINLLVGNLNDLVSQKNIASINKTLSNLEQVTGSVNSERENIQVMLQQFAQASKQANETLSQTTKLTQNANALLDTQGKQLLNDASRTMASLEQTSSTLNKLLKENDKSIGNGMQGLNELGPALSELHRTLTSLRNITNRLEENPAAFLSGQENPKEFTP